MKMSKNIKTIIVIVIFVIIVTFIAFKLYEKNNKIFIIIGWIATIVLSIIGIFIPSNKSNPNENKKNIEDGINTIKKAIQDRLAGDVRDVANFIIPYNSDFDLYLLNNKTNISEIENIINQTYPTFDKAEKAFESIKQNLKIQ